MRGALKNRSVNPLLNLRDESLGGLCRHCFKDEAYKRAGEAGVLRVLIDKSFEGM